MQDTRESTPATADRPLTIDTNGLRDLWLPSWREHTASLEHMDKLCKKAIFMKTFEPLHTARMAVKFQMNDMAVAIRDCGGLLLIGGAA